MSGPDKLSSANDFRIRVWSPSNSSLAAATREAREVADSAAQQGFNVGFSEILTKMSGSDEIIDFQASDASLAGFGCLIGPTSIVVGEHRVTVVYANGLIVDPKYGRRGISQQFLRVAGNKGEFVLGHTQNPFVVKSFRKVFPGVWPSEDHVSLTPEVADAIGAYLASIGRPKSLDRKTGLVKNLYPGPLYGSESEHDVTGSGTVVTGGDGILIVGFNDLQHYFRAVEPEPRRTNAWPLQVRLQRPKRATANVSFLDSLFVGAGHAAHHLHLPCIKKAAELDSHDLISGRVGFVERDPLVATTQEFRRFPDIAAADFDPNTTVVHLTTGPADRVLAVRAAAELGFRFFILEKPLAASRSQHDELLKIIKDNQLKIVVNYPWLGTPLTRRLKELIDTRAHGELSALTMLQTKSRSSRRREVAGCTSALDIETPHQVSLALHLAGERAQVLDASCKPLAGETGTVPFMGGASILLLHDRIVSNLRSDLDCRTRERRIELVFEKGWRCIGRYPPDGDDGSQELIQYDGDGRLHQHEKFFNDPLSSLFIDAYRYFAGTGPIPVSSLELAVATADLISTAKSHCGVEVESLEFSNF